jgi:RNA polymerase sigma-70 factor (ECF subfamily)
MLPIERVQQEQQLRRAVLAGDEAAWRTLYDGAFTVLWAYVVWRSAGMRELAEEITQETWLVAVRRIADFDPKQARFATWLRGIAANVLRNHFRAHRRRAEQSLADCDFPAPGDREECDQAELIARSLAELPERSEAVLRAKYLDLLSVDQIAVEWDETPKAIESLLTRARQAFRVAYEKLSGTDVAFEERKP